MSVENLIDEREAIEKAQKLYSEGHKEFPDVNMGGYNVGLDDGDVGIIVSYEGVRDGLCPLEVNCEFLDYPLEVQRAIIAHEYGHLENLQGKDYDDIQEYNMLSQGFEMVLSYCVACAEEEPDEEIKLSDEMQAVLELELEDEMLADLAAAKRGHGKPILDYLQVQYDAHKDNPLFQKSPLKQHIQGRIKNLEDALE